MASVDDIEREVDRLLKGVRGNRLTKRLTAAPERRDRRLDIRVSAAEKERIFELAERMGITATDLIVRLTEIAAERLPA